MSWLKKVGASISVAFVFALAVFAAMSAQGYKNKAKKWADKSVDIEEGKVEAGTTTAAAASLQAKVHETRADERKAKAEARITRIGAKNENIGSILDKWSAS